MRNPLKQEKPQEPEVQPNAATPAAQGVVVEREITLSLINDKLNYAIGLLHEVAKACEIDLTKVK